MFIYKSPVAVALATTAGLVGGVAAGVAGPPVVVQPPVIDLIICDGTRPENAKFCSDTWTPCGGSGSDCPTYASCDGRTADDPQEVSKECRGNGLPGLVACDDAGKDMCNFRVACFQNRQGKCVGAGEVCGYTETNVVDDVRCLPDVVEPDPETTPL